MNLLGIIQAAGTGLTGVGAIIVIIQLYQRRRQFQTEFEDGLTDKYRDIVYQLPVDALLDDSDTDGYQGDLEDDYRYIDLSNEQIFLRQEGRVSRSTWENWKTGIENHLGRDDFENAWEEIQNRDPESFNELRDFEDDDKPDDPRYWENPRRARLEEYWYRLKRF